MANHTVTRGVTVSIIRRAALLLGLAWPLGAQAQADLPPPPGWQQSIKDDVVLLSNPQGTVLITCNRTADTPPADIVRTMDQPGACTGLSAAAPSAILNGRASMWSTAGGVGCWLLSGRNAGRAATLLVMGTGSANGDAKVMQIATDRLSALIGNVAGTPQVADGGNRAGLGAGDFDARLKQAVAAIPAQSRPVGAVTYGTSSYVGWPPSYVYKVTSRMLFSNGLASTCADWDPGQFAPNRNQPPFVEDGCDLIPWRKTTGTTEFQSDDRSWSAADSGDGVIGFKPGERIDIDFGNVGGIGFNFGGGAGAVATSTISGGTLRMTSDGWIAVGDWSSTVISGSNIGGGSSRTSGPKVGRYYLDGHIIAIIDEQGQITRGFIAATDGDAGERIGHIYLNGRHYWDRDD